RLLVYSRATGEVSHGVFGDLPDLLPARTVTVVNDTRVVPARIAIKRPRGEVLLIEQLEDGLWEALARPSRRLRAGRSYGPVERVTLHVGLDTFRPLQTERVEEHPIHGERYAVAEAAWERIRGAEQVLAVGTTTVRVLETVIRGGPLVGRTELFITPGFEFRR